MMMIIMTMTDDYDNDYVYYYYYYFYINVAFPKVCFIHLTFLMWINIEKFRWNFPLILLVYQP